LGSLEVEKPEPFKKMFCAEMPVAERGHMLSGAGIAKPLFLGEGAAIRLLSTRRYFTLVRGRFVREE
jgi:hypothetical protein